MPALRDIAIDTVTRDLDLSKGSFSVRQGREAVAQRLLIKFGIHQGEWFLDTSFGIPYRNEVLVKNPDLAVIDALFRTALLETEYVISLSAYESTFDPVQRSLTLSFTALTQEGELVGIASLGTSTATTVSEEEFSGFPVPLFILSFDSPPSIME